MYPSFARPLPLVDPGAPLKGQHHSPYTLVFVAGHIHTPNQIQLITASLKPYRFTPWLTAMLLQSQYSTHRSLSQTTYTSSTQISNRHWTGLELLTLSCVLAWAPLSSNIFTHSTCPFPDAHISAVHPSCYREWHISVP